MDTFESDLADGSRPKLDAYYTRFVSGLPDDYQKQIRLNMPTDKQTIARAFDISLRYHAAQKGTSSKPEIGASVTFQDPSTPARVTQNETDIVRLKNRLAKVEAGHTQVASSAPQYSGTSPRRFSSAGRSSDYTSDSSQKSSDRMARFSQWNQGNRRCNNRGSFRKRTFNIGQQGQAQTQGQNSQGRTGYNSNSYSNGNFNPGQSTQTAQQAAMMDDYVSQTEYEDDEGNVKK